MLYICTKIAEGKASSWQQQGCLRQRTLLCVLSLTFCVTLHILAGNFIRAISQRPLILTNAKAHRALALRAL